ncbi:MULTISPECIES: hypothetical protein [unclassified Haladaptatus]|uniref:hypothetical protein n=1 Tax=unclassified Haladaptatus TaxID=2622732 RepID=UPI0023E7ED97|nr:MULTISPECIES: hypothetical protein [unclassified Haladaptatus]
MDRRAVLAFVAALVGFSLVAAPVTMGDWGEQASFSVDETNGSELRAEMPVLQYENLSSQAQSVVRRTIESPDNRLTIFGREDMPDEFFYSDYSHPGQGQYAIVYEGQYYQLDTYWSGGFPIIYTLFQLPFIVYGLVLVSAAYRTGVGERPWQGTALFAAAGITFHRLGPEFDFPVLDQIAFVGLGAIAVNVAVAWHLWRSTR